MSSRIERVLGHMRARGLTQLMVTDPKSIWYLTGVDVEPYERLFAFLLRTDGRHAFFLNNLYNVPKTEFDEVWFSDTDDSIGLMAAKIDRGARSLIFTVSASCVIRDSPGGLSTVSGTEKPLSMAGFWSFITKAQRMQAASRATIFTGRL